MEVELLSFGYKYGMPTEVNMVVDVRFLPNPYWEEHMRHLTGLDGAVAAYVLDSEPGRELLVRLEPLVAFVVSASAEAGKERLRLAIGCTGGHHRSVAVVERLGGMLGERGQEVTVHHRDIDNE